MTSPYQNKYAVSGNTRGLDKNRGGMKKIVWIAALTAVLGLTAFASISNSRVAGPAQTENRSPAHLPVVAPRGAAPSPAYLFMRSTHYA
jgi:hypothetical protein